MNISKSHIHIAYASPNVLSAGVLETMAKVYSFANVAPGWHYGQGVPANQRIISEAISALLTFALAGIKETDAFPGVEGEVMVTAYENAHYYEVIVETDGSVSLTYEVEDTEKFSQERMARGEATTKLQQLLGERWNTSAFYIRSTSTVGPSRIGSKVWLSEIPPMVEERLLSNSTALLAQMPVFATTPGATTPLGLQASHPFFGYLTKQSFRPATD